jgi:hypothetical protein
MKIENLENKPQPRARKLRCGGQRHDQFDPMLRAKSSGPLRMTGRQRADNLQFSFFIF